jgi:hypothetical protein
VPLNTRRLDTASSPHASLRKLQVSVGVPIVLARNLTYSRSLQVI